MDDSMIGIEKSTDARTPEEERENSEIDAKELPNHIWENILSWLPISSLLRMKTVCKTWNSIIHSNSFLEAYRKVPPQDLYFLLFADFVNGTVAAGYNPVENRWVFVPLSHFSSACPSTCCKLRRAVLSNGGLVLAEDRKGSLVVSNLFTKTSRVLPPMIPLIWPYVVAMVGCSRNSSYKILAVSTTDRIYSQVYDSESNSWEKKAEFDGRFAMLGNAAYMGGFLFCLSHGPDNLLSFDVDAGTWHLVEVTMPPVVCSYIFGHQGSLILVGGVEELGIMKSICIWELDKSAKQWRNICTMPHHLFSRFSHGKLNYFVTVCNWGKICFYRNISSLILMYDLSEKQWWWLPSCPFKGFLDRPSWFGLAVEPRLDAFV